MLLQLIIICPKLVSECQPHTYGADNGKDNLSGRQCKEETKKALELFPEECHRTARSCQTNDLSRSIFDYDYSDRT